MLYFINVQHLDTEARAKLYHGFTTQGYVTAPCNLPRILSNMDHVWYFDADGKDLIPSSYEASLMSQRTGKYRKIEIGG